MHKNKKELIIVAILFLIVILIFNYKIILNLQDASSLGGYLSTTSSIWYSFIKENLQYGIPLWDYTTLSGIPFIAHPLTAFFHPTSLLFILFQFDNIIGLIIILSLLICALFTYLYAKLIYNNKTGAFVAAIVFTLSGMSLIWSHVFSFLNAYIWIPAIFYLIEKIIRDKKYIYGIILSIIFSLQILGGGLQIVLFSFFVSILYFLIRLIILHKEKNLNYKIPLIFFIAIIMAILLTAIQILPTLEFSQYSIRSNGLTYEDASLHSLPPHYLITLLTPETFGSNLKDDYWAPWRGSSFNEFFIYLGIFPLILILISLFYKKDKFDYIFIMIALFSILFAFGSYTPFHYLFYKLPLFDSFRAPVRMMIFFIFSSSLLAAKGTRVFLENKENKNIKKIALLIVIISLISLLILLIKKDYIIEIGESLVEQLYANYSATKRVGSITLETFIQKVPLVYNHIIYSIIISTILIGISSLILYFKKRIRPLGIIIILFIIIELFIFNTQFIQTKPFSENFDKFKFIDFLSKDTTKYRVAPLRTLTEPTLSEKRSIRYKIDKIDSCGGISLKRYYEYLCLAGECEINALECTPIKDIKNQKLVSLLNVKYVLSWDNLNNEVLVEVYKEKINDKDLHVYLNKEAFPRAFIIPNAKIIKEKEEIISELTNAEFNPKEYIIIEEETNNLNNPGTFKEVEINEYTPNKITIITNNENSGFLILSEIYYPGWKAFIDGKETEIFRTNYILRSIYLEKGEHNVEFIYDPLSYNIGKYISIITLILIIILLLNLYTPKNLFN